MTDILLKTLLVLVCTNLLIYGLQIGKREGVSALSGWRLFISGFIALTIGISAALLASIIEEVGWLIEDDETLITVLSLVEYIGGYVLGLILIFGGFWQLLPHIGRKHRHIMQSLTRDHEKAMQANQAKSDFLAHMSHELRTPLNAILGFSELIQERPPTGKINQSAKEKLSVIHSYTAIIHDCATDLLSITNNILDLSKIEAGQFELSEAVFDIGATLDATVRIMRHRIESQSLEFIVTIDSTLPPLRGDERVIKQSILNLLTNAAKFTPAGGRIRLTATFETQKGYKLQVADNGRGMTREEIDRALTRFGQGARHASDDHSGTGLGLPLVRDFTQLHGGTLNLESEMGVGTSVTIQLPAERAHTDTIMPQPIPATGYCILLAEDNAANALLLKKILETDGYNIMTVENGKEALTALDRERFDMIIMDVHMPEMDGIEATRRIRQLSGPVSQLPILALTGDGLATDQRLYLNAGMTACLLKPVDPRTLRHTVAKIAAGVSDSLTHAKIASEDRALEQSSMKQ